MTRDPDDVELERRFAALRARDARSAPDFDGVWARATARASRRRSVAPARRLIAAGGLLAAAVLTVVVVRRLVTPRTAVVDVIAWRSPTDFLLRAPGDALLREDRPLSISIVPLASTPHTTGGTP